MPVLDLHAAGVTPDALLLLLAALLIEAAVPLGLRPAPTRPALVLARTTTELERRLDRPGRSAAKRLFRGAVITLFLVGAAVLAGWAVQWAAARVPFGWLAVLLLLAAWIDQRRPFEAARTIARELESGLGAGRAAASSILGPTAAPPDAGTITRMTAAFLSVRLTEGVVAPVFWFVLLGLPGLLGWQMVNVAGRTFSADTEFGLSAVRLNQALGFLPALAAGVLVAFGATFAPGAGPRIAFEALGRPGAAWPARAMAAALQIVHRKGGAGDIRRGLYLYAVACFLVFAAVAVLALLRFMA